MWIVSVARHSVLFLIGIKKQRLVVGHAARRRRGDGGGGRVVLADQTSGAGNPARLCLDDAVGHVQDMIVIPGLNESLAAFLSPKTKSLGASSASTPTSL